MARESIILFGEGKSEAIFLSHLKKVYSSQIQAKVKVDKGQGKTPRDIIDRLIKLSLQDIKSMLSSSLITRNLFPFHVPLQSVQKHAF